MPRIKALLILFFVLYTLKAHADCRGCCAGHGGVTCINGKTQCADGTSLTENCKSKGCNKCDSDALYNADSPAKAYHPLTKNPAKNPYNQWRGRVLAVVDGDTLNIMHDGASEKIRLYGIDAPEEKQLYGSEARIFAFKMVNNEYVTVIPTTTDKYGRTVAWVYLGDKCLNKEMLKNGLAWHYKKYSSDQELAELEEAARRGKAGLWNHEKPTAPWDFRHVTLP